ncbi:MAG: hypothetical protein PHV28_03210 [Kiritimatiellae bacterium]|nr:hypothetical protein [Kiritimatiellia bacterium]
MAEEVIKSEDGCRALGFDEKPLLRFRVVGDIHAMTLLLLHHEGTRSTKFFNDSPLLRVLRPRLFSFSQKRTFCYATRNVCQRAARQASLILPHEDQVSGSNEYEDRKKTVTYGIKAPIPIPIPIAIWVSVIDDVWDSVKETGCTRPVIYPSWRWHWRSGKVYTEAV